MRFWVSVIILSLLTMLASGCGTKGELYLPDSTNKTKKDKNNKPIIPFPQPEPADSTELSQPQSLK